MRSLFHILGLLFRKTEQRETEFLGYEAFSQRNMPIAKASIDAGSADPYQKAA